MRILLQTNYKGFTRLRQLTGYTPDENGVDFARVRVSGHGIIITSMGIAIAAAAVVVVVEAKVDVLCRHHLDYLGCCHTF